MRGQLSAQRRLEHPPGELRDQPARPRDLLRPQSRQRVLQRVRRQQPREPISHLLRGTLVNGGPRRLTHSGFHLLGGHGMPFRPQRADRSPRPHTEHRTDPAWEAANVYGMPPFKLDSVYSPTADQPAAIDAIARSVDAGNRYTTLLGA